MEDANRYFNVNREQWDQKVSFHYASTFYDVINFKRGKSSLQIFDAEQGKQ